MAKHYPPNPIWVEGKVLELLTALEAAGFFGLVDRNSSNHNNVYIFVMKPRTKIDGKIHHSGKMHHTKMVLRVSDHPPKPNKFPAENSIHPDGDDVIRVWGRMKRAYQAYFNERRSNEAKKVNHFSRLHNSKRNLRPFPNQHKRHKDSKYD